MQLELDHAGLATKDLERTRRAYEKLGFRLTARSMHAGTDTATGKVVAWGSGNHCAMLADGGYLELVGLVDATKPSNVRSLVERYEGLHIVALRCESADDIFAQAQAAGVSADPPAVLERSASFGENGDQRRRAAFANVYLNCEAYPEARFILIEHQTPEVLWQPHLLAHPNGCRSLEAVYLCVPSVEASVRRLTPLLGVPERHCDMYRFAMRRGQVWIGDETGFRQVVPTTVSDSVHRVGAAAFVVKSLHELRVFFDGRGIGSHFGRTIEAQLPCLWVGPSEAEHGILQFVEH